MGDIDDIVYHPTQGKRPAGASRQHPWCWRCSRHRPAEDSPSGLCSGCRAWLTRASDRDPYQDPRPGPSPLTRRRSLGGA